MENPMKLFVLAVIALLILGPQRFAGLGGTLGRTIRDFRNALRSAQDEARETFGELTREASNATTEFQHALNAPDSPPDLSFPSTYVGGQATEPPAPDAAAPVATLDGADDQDVASLASEPTAAAARELAQQARPQ
jgi:Sec-independent protein translocase protein TatA